ncbi:expressed unknown protein [Seminavis robusta]|uniref:Uncharacterized protein n=1 Tax=Seminavis robusta TaxID=568900 RepID=A0A9N8EKG4_9STRA|nr:expressed unknown protein [Seminavis robusta]|eukprot:Sro1146_g246300.1 n/a (276) ;mRNA; f:6051-6878
MWKIQQAAFSSGLAPTTVVVRHKRTKVGSLVPARLLSLSSTELASSSSFWLADQVLSSSSTPSTTTFEPVLNVPALASFVLIMTMAFVLRQRVNSINDAAQARIAALEALRDRKSKELNQEATTEEVQQAITAYQNALTAEESLRTLAPGIRLRAPNNPLLSEMDQQAARQFLSNNNNNNNNNTTPLLQELLDNSNSNNNNEYDPPVEFPPVALGALWTFVFGSQILLFLFLTMNDTVATEVFDSLAGDAIVQEGLGMTPASTVAETVGDIMSME